MLDTYTQNVEFMQIYATPLATLDKMTAPTS